MYSEIEKSKIYLALRAGARAIEKAKLDQGTIYCLNVKDPESPEISYYEAAKILKEYAESRADIDDILSECSIDKNKD